MDMTTDTISAPRSRPRATAAEIILAKRRAVDAERKRKQRALARAKGQPDVELVMNAIVEAFAFSLLGADLRTWDMQAGWQPVNSAVVITAAVDVLVMRGGYDRAATNKLVKKLIAPRTAHRILGGVPSLTPGPGMPIYNLAAPDTAIVRAE